MNPMLTIAIKAARNAGDIIQRASENINQLTIDFKTQNDYVTEIDRAAEQEIINVIRSSFPEHSFLAEETGKLAGNEYTWIIDPLDGTTNFLHGFPMYAISIALQHKNKLILGLVYDPLRNELFTAERGGGAMLNNRKIRVTQPHNLKGTLLGTGFPFKSKHNLDAYLGMFSALVGDTAGIRRAGAAALDLAYVAAGRLDGFWEIGLQPWDMAAGILLIQEAGGVSTDFSFKEDYLTSGNLITGSPKVHQLMYKAIEPHVTENLK